MTERAADAIVVGLGAVGSAALHEFARRGVRAIGIDRWSPPHDHGSSHGDTRITREAVGEGAHYGPLVLRSHAIWRELEELTGERLLLRCGFMAVGGDEEVAAAEGRPSFVERTIAAARGAEVPHALLTPDEAGRRHPGFRFAGHERIYFEPGGGLVYPERCIAAQLARAADLGAAVRRDERVLSITRDGAGLVVRTDASELSAATVVLTAGGWTAGLTGARLSRLRVLRQVLHWFQPDDPALFAPGRFPTFIWTHGARAGEGFYGFPIAPGATPGVKLATEQYEQDSDPDAIERRVDAAEVAAMHAVHADGRLRGLSRAALRSATCFYTVTPDSDFAIGRAADDPALLIASACSGHGFKHSAGVGEHLARVAIGEDQLRPEFALERAG